MAAKGIVIEKVNLKAKGTANTLRRCVKVQLIASGKKVLASLPGDGTSEWVDIHDEVFLMPTRRRDVPQAKYKVEKIANCSLHRLRTK